jgi:hypothetical protein
VTRYVAEVRGEEQEQACPDCGRGIHEGEGILVADGVDAASYAYRWSEGHEARFHIAVAGVAPDGTMRDGFVVLSASLRDGNLVFAVVEEDESPWASSEFMGRVLSREEALHGPAYPDLFALTDAITAHEERLSRRILDSIDTEGEVSQ